MTDALMGRCGFYCEPCVCGSEQGCGGCQAMEGKLFWGECLVARCSIAKGYAHCGECEEMPCEALKEVAYHPEDGDNGRRLQNLRAWKEQGFDQWLTKRPQSQG